MNVSVYENNNDSVLEGRSDSMMYETLNNVVECASNFTLQHFCPFCVEHFQFKFSLTEHLRSVHQHFMLDVMDKTIQFHQCPFCNGKFYGKHLTCKHALEHHPKVISEIYLETKDANNRDEGSCVFCTDKPQQKVNKRRVVAHIQQFHMLEYDDLFQAQFLSNSKELINDSDDCNFTAASTNNCFDMVDLKEQLTNLNKKTVVPNTHPNALTPPKSILKSALKSASKYSTNPPDSKLVRRVLRFDLQEAKPTIDTSAKTGTGKEETVSVLNYIDLAETIQPIHTSTPNMYDIKSERLKMVQPLFSRTVRKANIKSVSKPVVSEQIKEFFVFNCAKCLKMFSLNAELVDHVKTSHKQLTVSLQPLYQCAICHIKFFKNNYLKKHVKLHNSLSIKKCFAV